jgi:2-ketocyclohexanecarboxyl-CoA hydrolase
VSFTDIRYASEGGVATITIDRPRVHNALRGQTCEELIDALNAAAWDEAVGVIVLEGAGGRAFCSGGDQGARDGDYDGRGTVGLPVEELHTIIRDAPKPVIAKVRGWCIGAGNVLATLCDLTIASEDAVFGQVGPRVGSVEPGFGASLLARTVGQKRAKEMWFLCRRYPAAEALRMGLANAVVPADELDAEVARWCAEILALAPTALAIAKRAMNADTESIRGLANLGNVAVRLYADTDEAREGHRAFREKRPPRYRRGADRPDPKGVP